MSLRRGLYLTRRQREMLEEVGEVALRVLHALAAALIVGIWLEVLIRSTPH